MPLLLQSALMTVRGVMVMETNLVVEVSEVSVPLMVMTCVPGERSSQMKSMPDPIVPSRLDVHDSAMPVSSWSSLSQEVPWNAMGACCGNTAALLGEIKKVSGGVVPPPLPECPDNALVLYKDYSEEEVAKLTPLVESGEYQGLRKDTQYYRAYWLMKAMGVDSDRYLLALLQASWQAEDRPELRARYLAEFAEESAKVEPRPNDINWIGMEGRAVDALRELGRFDEASARLAKVPLDALNVADVPGATGADARRAQLRRTWLTYFDQQQAAIARRDSSAEPFDMIPRELALRYCIERTSGLDTHQQAFCTQEAKAVDEMRTALSNTQVDLKALSRPRSESGR